MLLYGSRYMCKGLNLTALIVSICMIRVFHLFPQRSSIIIYKWYVCIDGAVRIG